MAFDFPGFPTIGQKYTPSTGITYIWTGVAWDRVQPSKGGGVVIMPAGVIMAFAGITLPPGALWCDGSTFDQVVYPALYAVLGNSNVTPDLRGRVVVGVDRQVGGSFANRVTNTGVGNPGLDSKTMKATGGFDRYTIVEAQIPSHQHGGSGTTSTVSADHSHYLALNSGNDSVNHQHYVSGYADAVGNHYHGMTYAANNVSTGTAGGRVGGSRGSHDASTLDAGTHNHSMNFWSGTVSAWHQHHTAGSTGGISANHTHTYSFGTDWRGGSEAHPNVQPSMVLAYIIFTGEAV